MADITVSTIVRHDTVDAFIEKVHKVCATDPNLSYRSLHEIYTAFRKNQLLIALEADVIVGWLLRIPYHFRFQELAAGYVEDSYRFQGAFGKHLESTLSYAPSSCIVTFSNSFAHCLLHKFHFHESSIWEVAWLSKGKFRTHRLSLLRIQAIVNHYKRGRPKYFIYRKT